MVSSTVIGATYTLNCLQHSPISEKGNQPKFLTTFLGRQLRHILQENTHVALQRHKVEALPTADLPSRPPVVENFLETETLSIQGQMPLITTGSLFYLISPPR